MGYIHAVTPLEGYRLLIQLNTGSSITVDLSAKLMTARFAELSDEEVFNNVKTDREIVIWGDGILKIPLFELIDVAVGVFRRDLY
ncbi:hypothetical protein JCM14036_09900 [Desulfotomaculum defluvii]